MQPSALLQGLRTVTKPTEGRAFVVLHPTVNISATETVPSSSFILQLSLRFAGNETHKLSCANRLELWRRHVTAITSALISYTELVTHASRLSPQSQAVLCTRILKYFHCVQLYNNTSHLYPGACPKRGGNEWPQPHFKNVIKLMWLPLFFFKKRPLIFFFFTCMQNFMNYR